VRVGEADARAGAQLRREAVGAQPERLLDVGVARGRARVRGALEAHAVGELEAAAAAPGVAEVDGGVDAPPSFWRGSSTRVKVAGRASTKSASEL
jgi:hypothetical protein